MRPTAVGRCRALLRSIGGGGSAVSVRSSADGVVASARPAKPLPPSWSTRRRAAPAITITVLSPARPSATHCASTSSQPPGASHRPAVSPSDAAGAASSTSAKLFRVSGPPAPSTAAAAAASNGSSSVRDASMPPTSPPSPPSDSAPPLGSAPAGPDEIAPAGTKSTRRRRLRSQAGASPSGTPGTNIPAATSARRPAEYVASL